VIEAIADGNTTLAAEILDEVQPESPDNSTATVSACIGLSACSTSGCPGVIRA